MTKIRFDSPAIRFLKKAERNLKLRLFAKIQNLTQNSFPSDVKRVVNREEKVFRVRVGDYRIEYVVLQDSILITDINKRSKIYKKN